MLGYLLGQGALASRGRCVNVNCAFDLSNESFAYCRQVSFGCAHPPHWIKYKKLKFKCRFEV